MDLEKDGLADTLARALWGWVTVLTMLLAMCALFLARWWQSLPDKAGRFGAEFQQLRLGVALGAVAAVVIAASLFVGRPLVDDLGRIFLGALTMVGLAAAHRFTGACRAACPATPPSSSPSVAVPLFVSGAVPPDPRRAGTACRPGPVPR